MITRQISQAEYEKLEYLNCTDEANATVEVVEIDGAKWTPVSITHSLHSSYAPLEESMYTLAKVEFVPLTVDVARVVE